MSLGDLLTTEEKIASLQSIKKSLSMAIYSLCVQLGIDSESFDYSTYVHPNGDGVTGVVNPKLVELERHSKNLITVMNKLEELKNV